MRLRQAQVLAEDQALPLPALRFSPHLEELDMVPGWGLGQQDTVRSAREQPPHAPPRAACTDQCPAESKEPLASLGQAKGPPWLGRRVGPHPQVNAHQASPVRITEHSRVGSELAPAPWGGVPEEPGLVVLVQPLKAGGGERRSGWPSGWSLAQATPPLRHGGHVVQEPAGFLPNYSWHRACPAQPPHAQGGGFASSGAPPGSVPPSLLSQTRKSPPPMPWQLEPNLERAWKQLSQSSDKSLFQHTPLRGWGVFAVQPPHKPQLASPAPRHMIPSQGLPPILCPCLKTTTGKAA